MKRKSVVIKKISIVMTCIASLVFSMVGNNNTWATDNNKILAKEREQEYVITLDSEEEHNNIEEEYDIELEEVTNNDDTVAYTAKLSSNQAEKLEEDQDTVLVEKDLLLKGSGAFDTAENFNLNWNRKMISADVSETEDIDDENRVKVALIDSGVDYSSDLDVKERKNFVEGEDSYNILYEDDCGHGTCVAGVIAAKDNEEGATGVNSDVELYSAKVLDSENQAKVSQVVAAIDWAIEKEVNIINMSFGTSNYSATLEQTVKRAKNAGILMVAAAGNGEEVEYPAAFDEVMAVGSVGTDGKLSEGSATGEEIEIVAPGEQITSTGAFGGVMTFGGTSAAAPHVTGVASILWQKDLSVSNDFIRKILIVSAKEAGPEEKYGAGIVDLEYAESIYEDMIDEFSDIENKEDGVISALDSVQVNTQEVETFDCVNTVEGRWGSSNHEALVSGLSGDSLKVMKIGAVLQDKSKYGLNGKGTFPQFHGYYAKRNLSTATNYIGCYLILSKMAVSYASGSYSDPANISGLNTTDYDVLKSAVGNGIGYGSSKQKWATILDGYTVNAKNKSLVLYGMALHTASDVFSHSAVVDGMRLSNVDGDQKGQNRYASAEYVAKKLMKHVNNGVRGYVSDFAVPASVHGNKFKLAYISDFANNINQTTYSDNKSTFDALNITSFSIPD